MYSIISAVEKNRKLILDAENFIWKHPETGFKEKTTADYIAKVFTDFGYKLVYADGLTGFYTRIETGRPGPEVMILAELDAILCPSHPNADPSTGAVHACGHHAQCAAMIGIAAALAEPGALDDLNGSIRLCLVPAEENIEIKFRTQLKNEGKITYLGGKTEFLHRGMFDGVDMALMVHTSNNTRISAGSVGIIVKDISYKGKASHAGSSPWDGINALYAANCGINAVNSIRETFKEADIIRVHPIITKGGDIVNVIPETVQMESYVRGKTFEAIVGANRKVNRALIGAALSIGANIEIVDIPGYAPLNNDNSMRQLLKEAADTVIPEHECFLTDDYSSDSTDMGDLSCIMPVVQPHCGGAFGVPHSNNYRIADVEKACVDSAKWQLAALYLLLSDNAMRAENILTNFKPMFESKEAYLAFIDSMNNCGNRISYQTDGTAVVDLK